MTLVLEGTWFDVHNPKNGYRKDTCFKEIRWYAQNVITILGFNDEHNWEMGGYMWPYNEHEDLHFDNEQENSHEL